MTECPHCKNQIGFVFGMCIECGYNHLSKRFQKIVVWEDDLYRNVSPEILINIHKNRTRNQFSEKNN